MEPVLHLDHAATSHPKAPGVTEAVLRWYDEFGVSPDRGDSARCAAVGTVFERARAGVAALLGVPAHRVAWTSGATEALHLFFTAALRPGWRVVTTACVHSSVARPLWTAHERHGIALHVVPVDRAGRLDPADVERAIRDHGCDLLVLNHASNVTGVVQELAPCLTAARAAGALSLVDASQTVGALDLTTLEADAFAASAHKSLLAPPGLGFLATRPDLHLPPRSPAAAARHELSIVIPRNGRRRSKRAPQTAPRCPASMQPYAGRQKPRPAESHARLLGDLAALADHLREQHPGIRVLAVDSLTDSTPVRLPILSLTAADWDPAELGILCDQAGLQVRSGFHCAPWIHRHLGTPTGTLRISPGPFVTSEQLLRIRAALP